MTYWKEKVAIVTGGSAGLGFELARALCSRGARVILAARDAERLQAAVRELAVPDGRILAVPCDVTQDAEVASLIERTIAHFGQLNLLINNAGRSTRGLALETPLATYRELWELNFLAAVRCSQAAAPHLMAQRGHLVHIGSLASKAASPYLGAYPSSKFPLAAFAQQLRLEVDADQLHVLLVCPGPIARQDAGRRYAADLERLPESARRPGGGVKLKGIPPAALAERILAACERRQAELVLPARARWLFGLSQLWPRLADRILAKMTK